MKANTFWSWLVVGLGVLYFFVPLVATLLFSLRAKRGVLSFRAYELVLQDPRFAKSFALSIELAVLTILVSLLIIVPTAYWVQLRLPRARPVVEFVTLLPFVVPAVVLVFGLIRIYSRPFVVAEVELLPALTNNDLTSNFLLVCAYTVLSFPYMYRAVDTGLRAIDVRTLTEAAQSLGASWPTILWNVIFPNLRAALLSGAFLTFAIVIGEFTVAVFLARPTFGPYLSLLIQNKAYEPAALSILSFALTWGSMGISQFLSRGVPGQVAGAH
ncbi:MAG: ABC transporter permease subunit [Chloroflexi bacterium]|nr:ABC transporter permease subunit [Chloroflexota bacterium]